MSSFPQHEDNIMCLKDMGMDVSECLDEEGNVTMDSWGYDELVYLMSDIITELMQEDYKFKKEEQQ